MNSAIQPFHVPQTRRALLRSLLLTTGGIITSDLYAEALTLTPRVTEGPYYPDHLPLDQDNDFVTIKDGGTAEGVIANFGGRLLNMDGKPISGAVIELWQADNKGCYIHSNGAQRVKESDTKLQDYGKIETNTKGEYRFRTIKPGLYTGRTFHWHVRVKQNGRSMLTTQLFIAGVPQNDRDGILRGMGTEKQRLSVIREFKPVSTDSRELIGAWDIVLGSTPEDAEQRRGGPPPRRRDNDQDIKDLLFGPAPF
jgi:protocatechuate 3,4-dioxygenase beta subunit